MTLLYHSGLAKPQRTLVAEEFQARLAMLPYLKYVGRIAVPLEAVADDKPGMDHLWDLVRGQSPFALVALGRAPFEQTGVTGEANQWSKALDVHVYIGSSHRRGLVAGRSEQDAASASDDTLDPGIDAMLEQVGDVLHGVESEHAGIQRARPQSEDIVGATVRISVWRMTYRVILHSVRDPYIDVTDLVAAIHAEYNVEGGGALNPIITTETAVTP